MHPDRKIHPRQWHESVGYDHAYNPAGSGRARNPYRAEALDYTTFIPAKKERRRCRFVAFYQHATRFFESRIGRPWSKVHAEICSRVRDLDLRASILEMVETDVVIHGGVVYGAPSRWTAGHPRSPLFRSVVICSDGRVTMGSRVTRDLFVHPRTGILYGHKSHYLKQIRHLKKTSYLPPL